MPSRPPPSWGSSPCRGPIPQLTTRGGQRPYPVWRGRSRHGSQHGSCQGRHWVCHGSRRLIRRGCRHRLGRGPPDLLLSTILAWRDHHHATRRSTYRRHRRPTWPARHSEPGPVPGGGEGEADPPSPASRGRAGTRRGRTREAGQGPPSGTGARGRARLPRQQKLSARRSTPAWDCGPARAESDRIPSLTTRRHRRAFAGFDQARTQCAEPAGASGRAGFPEGIPLQRSGA